MLAEKDRVHSGRSPGAGPPSRYVDPSRDAAWGEARFAAAARSAWSELPLADVAGAVEAAFFTEAQCERADAIQGGGGTGSGEDADAGAARARQVGEVASAASRHALAGLRAPVDWSPFGQVLPVLGAAAGVGATVTVAVLADALQLAGVRVLVVDTADPARSGLAAATRTEGGALPGPHEGLWLRCSWRANALLLRMQTRLAGVTPGMVPLPGYWRPPVAAQVSVVDVGFDAYRALAHPLGGAGAWLRRGTPSPRPLLVVRPARPSLAHAEQALARLESWAGYAVLPARLVVAGARRWPAGVAGAAGRRVQSLLDSAVFLPHDPAVAVAGVSAAVTPTQLRRAVTPLLRDWGLLPGPGEGGVSWQQVLRPAGGAR